MYLTGVLAGGAVDIFNARNYIKILVSPFKLFLLYHGFFSVWWCYVMWNKENLHPRPGGLPYVLMVNIIYVLSQFFWIWSLVTIGGLLGWHAWTLAVLGLTVTVGSASYAYGVVNRVVNR